jgi:hypothetical protein
MLYLHDFYNIIFKIELKLYTASGSPPPTTTKERFWVRPWVDHWFEEYETVHEDGYKHCVKCYL